MTNLSSIGVGAGLMNGFQQFRSYMHHIQPWPSGMLPCTTNGTTGYSGVFTLMMYVGFVDFVKGSQ